MAAQGAKAAHARPQWSDIKAQLAGLDKPALIDLVKDLFDSVDDNRAFLAARFPLESNGNAALEVYRRQVIEAVYPQDECDWYGDGSPDFEAAQRSIAQYQRATADLAGTLDLLLTVVETGTRYTCDLGDIDEDFYAALEQGLEKLGTMLQTPEGAVLYPRFQQRLRDLAQRARDIGWGYGDSVQEQVYELEATLSTEDEGGSEA